MKKRQTISSWYVYILRCSDDTYYTGITTDLKRRTKEHNTSLRGARYTRTRRPVLLTYHEVVKNRSKATSRERVVKNMSHAKKASLTKVTVPKTR